MQKIVCRCSLVGKRAASADSFYKAAFSSRNPEDGEIYLTCFTENKITCCYAGCKIAWEVEVNEDQQQKVKEKLTITSLSYSSSSATN